MHFDVYYYPKEEAAVRMAARGELILYAVQPHFQQTNALAATSDHGRATESQSHRENACPKRSLAPAFDGLLLEGRHWTDEGAGKMSST